MKKFLAFCVLSLGGNVAHAACKLNLYLSSTTVSDRWLSPASCGLPEWEDYCVTEYIDGAQWHWSHIVESPDSFTISGGSGAYVLLEYDQASCGRAEFFVTEEQSTFIGQTSSRRGWTRRLFALNSDTGRFNTVVNLINDLYVVRRLN